MVRWQGAYFLRDGNRRALGLYSRGISRIPVLYREYADNEDPRPAGGELFDQSVFLGDRPPMLPDFLDNDVSAPIEVRATQKTFIFHATEQDVATL